MRLLTGSLAMLVLLFVATPSGVLRAAPNQSPVLEEIEALLGSLGESGCMFYRNGTWHAGASASDHLRRKFDYLQRKGRITVAEDFIADAATQSSLSGEVYQVRCAGQPAEPSADWLMRKLDQMRASAGSRSD